MTEAAAVVISVRGDAQRLVPPDLGVVQCAIRTVAPTKAAALQNAAAAQDALIDDLRHFGAVPFTADAPKQPVAWLTRSAITQPEHGEKRDGSYGPTGNVIGLVAVLLYVRDFARRDDLDALLARHEQLDVQGVDWQVDADNPAWPEVRAAAIRAAIARGRDYAAALGGALVRIEQVADAGLLGEVRNGHHESFAFAASGRQASFDDSHTPSLDPVPQTVFAVIDARFTASVAPLA
jgi:uncharacterized protein